MIVDGHLDIAWNALAEGRPFDLPAPKGYMVSRQALMAAGVGLIFPTIYTAPAAALKGHPGAATVYRTAREACIMGRLQAGFYKASGLRLLRNRRELKAYARAWQPGQLAGVLLMENADPIETPAQLGLWADLGVRVIGPAWMRTRYCGGTDAPGRLTALGRDLLRAMQESHLVLDLSHMADRSMRDSFELWQGTLCATHAGARELSPGQRQLPRWAIEEIGRRDGIVGISFYGGHLSPKGKATTADVVSHAVHYASVTGDARHVGIGTDLDGGFGADKAAIKNLDGFARLRTALGREFNSAEVDGILGGNWLRFLGEALPA